MADQPGSARTRRNRAARTDQPQIITGMPQHAVKFAAISCTHVPQHDPEAVEWACGEIARIKPDVLIHLGDLLESNASSRWEDAREANWTLSKEFEDGDAVLSELRRAAGKRARCVIIEGNHEANILAAGRLDPRIRDRCDWRHGLKEIADDHWQVGARYDLCRKRGIFRIGQVAFAHGWSCARLAIQREAFYATDQNGLYVSGHTHRPVGLTEVTWCDLPLRTHHINPGCTRDLDPSYMERNRKWSWGQGIVTGWAEPTKSPRQTRCWRAELTLRCMFDEWAARH